VTGLAPVRPATAPTGNSNCDEGSHSVFLVGPRSPQHAWHSGYEGFRRFTATDLDSPCRQRNLGGSWGWRVDEWLARCVGRPGYSVPLLANEMAAARHMLRHRGAVYHVLYGDSDYWLLGRAGRRTGNAVVATFHEEPAILESLGVDERYTRDLTGVILLGEVQRPFFDRLMPPERIFVVPHGIDTDFFTPGPRTSGDRVCLTVGGHWRDHETLAEAIAIVRRREPTVRFVAVGANIGQKGARLECEGVDHRQGLSDEELRQSYRDAAVAVFAFQVAVASNSVLEAMACGLPIVATDVGGIREYVGTDAGVLTEPWDAEELANAVLHVLADASLAAALGQAARKRALGFAYGVVATRLQEVYRASRILVPRAVQ
jgi:glycosyltransferase involved in cell wall biosynthesis